MQDRLLGWRDRLLTRPGFRRWAAGFPLTRPLARARARALFDLCAGFVYSQVLDACVETGLIDRLAQCPQPLDRLATQMDLEPAAAARLLEAARSLKLVSRRSGGRYGLGALGGAMIGDPGIAAMVKHHRLLYRDLADPLALLRGEGTASLQSYWRYTDRAGAAALGPEAVADYSALMDASQAMVRAEILDAYPFQRHRRMLDIGGGTGGLIADVAAKVPALSFDLFDLPGVVAEAETRFAAHGVRARVATTGGSFLSDPLPKGADLATLVRVCFDHPDEFVCDLLARVRQALVPGGRLMIAEPMAQTPGADPVGDAYFGFYLLAMGGGRPRTVAQFRRFLLQAGFRRVREHPTRQPMIVRVLSAVSPA